MLATNHAHAAANGFVVYDTETTGLSKAFDQITQIAAIRTDAEFTIIDENYDVLNQRGRRLPWIVPSPGAMLVTGASADDYERCGTSHYEMMGVVAGAFAEWAPAIFIAFNGLRFDEELLRTNLFSTLHPPYLTSAAGCGRADAYLMLKTICAIMPGAIVIPEIDGKPCLKLGAVLRANNLAFAEADAHDALADVKGTIALIKLMKSRAPAIFDHLLCMAYRREAQDFIEANTIFRRITWFGSPQNALATRIAANPANPNQIALFDLAHDPAPYLNLSVEELAEALRASPRVISTIKLNAQPTLLPCAMVPASPDDTDDYTMEARVVSITLATDFQQNVATAMQLLQERYPSSPHVEEQLYEGFPSWADKHLAARFHLTSDWRQRYRMIGTFDDLRLRTHALRLEHFRAKWKPVCVKKMRQNKNLERRFDSIKTGNALIYAECPNALPLHVLETMHDWCRGRLLSLDDELPHRTIHTACEELQSLKMQIGETGGDPGPAGEDKLKGKSVAERLEEIEHYYLMLAAGHQ